MTKKQKNDLLWTINGFGILLGFYLWYKFSLNIIWLLAVLILPSILGGIIIRLIPSKAKKAKSKGKTPSSNKSSKKLESPLLVDKKGHNLLRSEKEILTLPLEKLTWREFERLCYFYYKAKGYKPTETSEGADGGVDLIIYNRHHQQHIAIQIKHYVESGKQVTVREIRELDSSKKNHKCILAEFISSTGYTNAALIEADKRKIKCHTVEKILRWREEEAKKKSLA